MSNSQSQMQAQIQHVMERALVARQPWFERWHAEQTDCYRLLHGTVEGAPGLTVDRYGPQLIVQSFHRPLAADELEQLVELSQQALGRVLLPFYHHRQRSQKDPSTAKQSLVVDQPLVNEAVCSELGVKYRTRGVHRGIDPLLFLDLRAGRRWVQQQAAGLSVLNLFAYTCGVGVCAANAGAARVVNVDFARSSLAVGRENADLNGIDQQQIEFIQSDFFPAVQQLAGLPVRFRRPRQQQGRRSQAAKTYPRLAAEQFDLVFLDPPKWAKSPFGTVDLVRDYPSVFKPSLLATKPGGRLVCCNNVAQVDRDSWIDQLQRSARKAGRPVKSVELIQPEADFPSFDDNPPLKIAVLEV